MHKLTLYFLLLCSIGVKAENKLSFSEVDSITYQCYLLGDWDKLIETGEQAIKEKIDFKTLRQRLGYAFFMKGDYYTSQKQYEKALEFDKYDTGTREYLYYCASNTGDEASARYHAAKLPVEQRQALEIKAFKPVAALDFEINYKTNNYEARSNPFYFRAGIKSNIGNRLSLYQSVSNYRQTINTLAVRQPDYFALVNLAITSRIKFSAAYHYLSTSIDGTKYPGNLVFGKLSAKVSRFGFGVNGSYFKYDLGKFWQVGADLGVTLPGKQGICLNTALNYLMEPSNSANNRFIFSQVAGTRISKSLWIEGRIDVGNLQNYNDHDALYIYNSLDPTIFRTGASLYWYVSKNITLYGNYLYDTKQIWQTSNQYIQHSFLTGIIWKL